MNLTITLGYINFSNNKRKQDGVENGLFLLGLNQTKERRLTDALAGEELIENSVLNNKYMGVREGTSLSQICTAHSSKDRSTYLFLRPQAQLPYRR
jgi:hypothetical protein